jgi:dTDP-L-rhamnose 4-epimerase
VEKHVLITGGAGFIGSHLCDLMLAKGYRVSVLDCLLPQVHQDGEVDDQGWPTYLNSRVHRLYGNAGDPVAFRRALKGVTHLIHLAASVGVGQSMTDIVFYTQNNTMVAANMLQILSDRSVHTVERMAVASSMSIYGEGAYRTPVGKDVPVTLRTEQQLAQRQWEIVDGVGWKFQPIPTKETKRLEPASIYAIGKRDHEEMFLVQGRALGIPTIALRLFNAYGSRQALSNPYTGVAAIFIGRLANGESPMIFEDGNQMRDFVHVKDVANAFYTVIDSDYPVWDAYNVGSGKAVTVNDIAHILMRLMKSNHSPEILNKYRVGDIRHCFADIDKIQRVFGWVPQQEFEQGMAELIDWVKIAPKPIKRGDALSANAMVK